MVIPKCELLATPCEGRGWARGIVSHIFISHLAGHISHFTSDNLQVRRPRRRESVKYQQSSHSRLRCPVHLAVPGTNAGLWGIIIPSVKYVEQ